MDNVWVGRDFDHSWPERIDHLNQDIII